MSSQQSTLRKGALKNSKNSLITSNMTSTTTPIRGGHKKTHRDKDKGNKNAQQQLHMLVSVFDDEGNDVTPQPLVAANAKLTGFKNDKETNKYFVSQESSATASQRSIQESAIEAYSNLESALQFSGLSGTSRRLSQRSSQANNPHMSEAEEEQGSLSSTGSVDEEESNSYLSGSLNFLKTGTKKKKQLERSTMAIAQSDTNELIKITLSETDTIWLLDIPSVCVGMDPIDESAVRAANARYNQVRMAHLSGDNYVHRSMQTFNYIQKQKEVQCMPARYINVEVQVDSFEIHDATVSMESIAEVAEEGFALVYS